jgi:predicted unusual protein kinase regulating ubiquinone biosynthesis (AarF/ABC1/UbiB family)
VLAGSRKEVVIKVLRPGTEDVLLTDLNFVSFFSLCLSLQPKHDGRAPGAACKLLCLGS